MQDFFIIYLDMNCILAVIKNEHLYLDEWIRYHLNLGIEHIFVFEDIDSESHREITDKYGDKVSLSSIYSVLNEEDSEKARWLKKTKKWNAQHLYYRNALKYIAGLQEYDWCFVIDADEFITLESGTLDSVLSMYADYEAFIMLWKCYGANGYISKPDYTNKGVIDIYEKEIDNKWIDKPKSVVKTCYNMRRYKSEFFHNQHRPADICRWCNTDFKRNINKPTYRNIYIRHYVTKSWEEYVWKRRVRGFLWGGTRNFDMFFNANPELSQNKKELIKNANIGRFTL